MSNLHAAGLAPTQLIDIPVTALLAGQTVIYGGQRWTVAEVLDVYPLGNAAVIGVGRDGVRRVLMYANADSCAQLEAW